MKLIRLAITNSRFVSIILILMLMNGLFSFFTMPRYEDPIIPSSGCTIRIIYPGANALEVEVQIIKPIEEALSKITGLKSIMANAQNDNGSIFIEYEHSLKRGEKFAEISREVDNIRQKLPQGITDLSVEPVVISDANIYQFAITSEAASYGALKTKAEELKARLETIHGIRKVEIHAVPDQQVVVAVNLEKLAGLKIPLSRVMSVIQSSNTFIPSGSRDIGTRKFNIYTNSKFTSLDDVRNTVIKATNGKIVYLRDIAKVQWNHKEEIYRAKYNRKKAVFITTAQKAESNIEDIAELVEYQLAEYKAGLGDDYNIEMVFNQFESVEYRISNFFVNLAQGIVLVGFVILLFVGFSPSVVVMTVVPFSLLIGIGIVDAIGFGMQQLTIVGLVVALGLLVDNAIVVVENIVRYLEMKYPLKEAIIKGTGQVTGPLVSSTLTTVLAFAPLAFINETGGDFIRSLPITVIFTLLASLVVALGWSPIVSKILFKNKNFEKKIYFQKGLDNFVVKYYSRLIDFSLRKPALIIGTALLAFLGAIFLFAEIGIGFFPKAEKPFVMVNIDLPIGSSLNATDSISNIVENILDEKTYVTSFATNIGFGNPVIHYSLNEANKHRFRKPHQAQILVKLTSRNPKEVEEYLKDLNKSFDNNGLGTISIFEFQQGNAYEAPLVFKLTGENLNRLKEISFQVDSIISNNPATFDVKNPMKVNQTDLEVHINKAKASIMGVGLDEINKAIKTGISGLPISRFNDDKGESYDIVVQLSTEETISIGDFDKIYVESYSGAIIPLKQLADIRFRVVPFHIQHLNKQRAVTITSNLQSGYNLNKVANEIAETLDNFDWPQGYSYRVGGVTNAQNKTFRSVAHAALIAFVCIFAILVLQFKSIVQPLIIFSALPFAIIGSVFMLFVTGNTFSFTAFVGMTSLIGIVVNDSILLVDFANQERRAGKSIDEAIKSAGKIRFAPIVLTSLTTIAGLLPLTFAGGSLWVPMGWTLIGGLMTSTILILLVVPVLYKLFSDKLLEVPE